MLPINDTEPNRYSRQPYMTLALILANMLVMAWELSLSQEELYGVFLMFGTSPALISPSG